MSEKLQKSLAFLNSEMPNNWLSLAVTQLPKRNIFQSIGDFFAGKSGNHRISYLAASKMRSNSFIIKVQMYWEHNLFR